jgi:ABC-type Zn uptake system ZnuABC Zn-binding protein ZnuA
MAMTADEVYEALKVLHKATALSFEKRAEELDKRFSALENRLEQRINGISDKLAELGGPGR